MISQEVLDVIHSHTDPSYIEFSELKNEYIEPDSKWVIAHLPGSDELVSITPDNMEVETEISGVALGGIYDSPEALSKSVNVPPTELLSRSAIREDDFPVGQVKALFVKPEFRGSGIGFRLSEELVTNLWATLPIISMIWERDEITANKKIAENFGQHQTTFENYFGPEWNCPDCEQTCDCAASLYAMFEKPRE